MSDSLLHVLSGRPQAGILLWFPPRKTKFPVRTAMPSFQEWTGIKIGSKGDRMVKSYVSRAFPEE